MRNRTSLLCRVLVVSLCLLVFISSSVAYAIDLSKYINTRNPDHAYIPGGTSISCELITALNSGRNYQGERVIFKTTGAVQINNVTVIPVGAVGEALVSEVHKAGGFGRGGSISITTRYVKAVNGAEIPVKFELQKSGGGQGGWVVPAFLVVTILAGFIQGQNQDLPAGTRFNVAVENDYDLGVEPDKLAEVMVDPNAAKPVVVKRQTTIPDIMTIEQAALYMQVSPEVVQNMIAEGKLRAIKIGDDYRIKKSDIDNM